MGAPETGLPFLKRQDMINWIKWDRLRRGHTNKPKKQIVYLYIDPSSGNGDAAYNLFREIIDQDRKDQWAHNAVKAMFKTLDQGKRWPDYAEEYIDPGLHDQQLRMTQDPWLLAYCCAVHLGRYDLIRQYRPPVKVFNLPDKWAWRRALLGKPNLWWLWRRIIPYCILQDFVYVFYGYMEQAYLTHRKNERNT